MQIYGAWMHEKLRLWKLHYLLVWILQRHRRDKKMKSIAFLAWFDAWIGAYWNWKKRVLYLIPVPTIVFGFGKNEKDISVEKTTVITTGFPALALLLMALILDALIIATIRRLICQWFRVLLEEWIEMRYTCPLCDHVFDYDGGYVWDATASGSSSWQMPINEPKYCPQCGGRIS